MDTGVPARAQWFNNGNHGSQHLPVIPFRHTFVLFFFNGCGAVATGISVKQAFES
jgi:hypothetical protein